MMFKMKKVILSWPDIQFPDVSFLTNGNSGNRSSYRGTCFFSFYFCVAPTALAANYRRPVMRSLRRRRCVGVAVAVAAAQP